MPKPEITVDLALAAVDITTAGGLEYRFEVLGESVRIWAPNGDTLAIVPRSTNVVEARAIPRRDARPLGI